VAVGIRPNELHSDANLISLTEYSSLHDGIHSECAAMSGTDFFVSLNCATEVSEITLDTPSRKRRSVLLRFAFRNLGTGTADDYFAAGMDRTP